ncbi:amino acid permease [Methanoregula sp.]|uniref:amino acid permease n=1 Tax=Methanoregula sp. TaxID=2052170 RepID=UPI002C0398D1|nr:amino acid permease [Methanoregula sp.]HVP97581.1 amino acid permease [Methanoregula sp.]
MNKTSFLNHSMFKKKPIEQSAPDPKGSRSLSRTLSTFDLVMLGIGGIIGMGIFVLSGLVAGLHAGNALPLSLVIAGISCLFAALCYAEFSAMIPLAGSAYTYCYMTLGEIWAWIIGWDLILEYGLAVSAVAIGWSGYFNALLRSVGVTLPPALTSPPGMEGGMVNLPAIAIVLCLSLLLIRGAKKSARTNAIIVAIKIAVIVFFIVLGLFSLNPANWTPFMPPKGWLGVFSGAAIFFFAFIGFDAVVTAAEETKNPQKSLPLGLIGSLVICLVIYIILGVILTGIVPFAELAGPDAINAPIAYALGRIGFSWGAFIVSIGALCGMTSVILVMLFGQSRIFFAMSRDGLLPAFFSDVHEKTRTPVKVILVTGVLTACVAGFFPIEIVAELVNMGTLMAFAIVAIGILLLRVQRPDLTRPFRCPGVPLIPLFCVGTCAFLIFNLSSHAHLMFVIWLALGLAIYFLYGVRKETARQKGDPLTVPGPGCIPCPGPALGGAEFLGADTAPAHSRQQGP